MMEEKGYRILEDVSYYGDGEPFWKLDLALPEDAHNGKRPAVLIVHGGGFEMCNKREEFESRMLRFLAGHGYVAASVEYRLSAVAPFPSPFVDVRRALQFVRGMPKNTASIRNASEPSAIPPERPWSRCWA